jgi:glyoxylase-like metal-dependent hydrolase (beta-lactamase superfamily II)
MVHRWDIITIGNLSRNRYWGESDERPLRPGICTCTLVRGRDFCLLVDPSIEERGRMLAELDRRTGLKPEAVDTVFITHQHGDHHFGLQHFPRAEWLAAPGVAEALNKSGRYEKEVRPAAGGLFGGAVELVPSPGHTPEQHSLRFYCDGLAVVVAGDAVMTREFWADRRGYFNSADFELAARTIDALTAIADIIVPGHDNYFSV